MERIDFFDTILDLLVKSMYDNGFITHCVCDETVVDVLDKYLPDDVDVLGLIYGRLDFEKEELGHQYYVMFEDTERTIVC